MDEKKQEQKQEQKEPKSASKALAEWAKEFPEDRELIRRMQTSGKTDEQIMSFLETL